MKKDTDKTIKILLIALLALFIQVFITTHVYALEGDNEQETILVEEEPSNIANEAIKEEPNIINNNNELKESTSENVDLPKEETKNVDNKVEPEEIIENNIEETTQLSSTKAEIDNSLVDNTPLDSINDKEPINNLKEDILEQPENISKKESENNQNNDETVKIQKGQTRSGGPYDVSSFVVDADIATSINGENEYEVQVGSWYYATLTFQESPGHQFPNDGLMVYELPDGFDIDLIKDEGDFSITVNTPEGKVTVDGNHYSITNEGVNKGKVLITWSTTDEDVHKLFAANNAKFYLRFKAYFDGGPDKIEYNDVVVTPMDYPDTESKLEMKKTSMPPQISSIPSVPSTIEYVITLNSTGYNQDINITDTLKGEGVTLDPDSFTVSSNGALNYEIIKDVTNNKFTFKADKMVNNQTVTITYKAKLDERFAARDENNSFYITANNVAVLESNGHTDPNPEEVNNKIEIKPSIYKVGKIVGTNEILWAISVNVDNKLLVKDMPIIDETKSNGNAHVGYTGEGIDIEVYNEKGIQIDSYTVAWSDLAVYAKNGWTYVIPTTDDHYRYEIKYTTQYDGSGLDDVIENDVHFGDSDSSSGIPIHGESDISLSKKENGVDLAAGTVTWEITIEVPSVGLDSSNNVLKETYPSSYIPALNKTVYEPVIGSIEDGSIIIEGLKENENCEFVLYNDASRHYATLTFTKNGEPGLLGLGYQRNIKITLKTPINQEWLEQVEKESWLIPHTNNIEMSGKSASAVAQVSKPTIIKMIGENLNSKEPIITNIDGIDYPLYKYTVKMGMLGDESIQIDDIFDTSIFKMYIPTGYQYNDYLMTFGGDTFYNQNIPVGGNQGWVNPVRIDYLETATGIRFIIGSDKLPKKEDGKLYNYYSFAYYLIPKDLTSLSELMQRAANSKNHTYNFDNTINYEDKLTASIDGVYYYNALSKKEIDPNPETEDVHFEIEINPNELVLNNMGTITLEDTFENFSIIYESIEVTPSEGITYDTSGNKITFELPDAKKIIIRYSGKVIYKVNGQDVKQEYSNSVLLIAGENRFEDSVGNYKVVVSQGGGEASIYEIKLMKYEAGNMAKRLSGAIFELLDANLNNILDKNGKIVSFESDENGMIIVSGDEDVDGWSLSADTLYYLRETKAPNGYMLANFDYKFTISKDNQPDYEHYIYRNDDTMTAKNYPGTDVIVYKEWEDGNEKHESDEVTVQLQERYAGEEKWRNSEVAEIVLKASNDWKGKFAELPLIYSTDEEDLTIEYQVIETKVNGVSIEELSQEYELIVNDNSYIIVNKNSSEIEATIDVLKILTGKEWTENDSFVFTVTPAEGSPLPEKTEVTITKDTIDYKDSFGKIVFTEVGTYTYTISEAHKGETINGITYDAEDKTVIFIVTKDEKGNLLVTTADNTTSSVEFTNEYSVEDVEATIDVLKVLNGKEWTTSDSFVFSVTPAEGSPLPEKTKVTITKDTKDYKDSFGKIIFTKAGTYTYTISEEHKGETINGITYDAEDKTVTFIVTDDGKGNLVVTTADNTTSSVEFTNTYSAEEVEATIDVLKVLTGKEWTTSDSFVFTITTSEGSPLPEKTEVTITKDTKDYKDNFGKIIFKKAGTYTYTISEEHKGETINGITYDAEDKTVTFIVTDDEKGNLIVTTADNTTSSVEFTNEYSVEGVEATIDVLKVLTGKEWSENDSFVFTITTSEGSPVPEKTSVTITKDTKDYKDNFGKIIFTKTGTYTYTISETHKGETINGITYDAENKTVTFIVTDDGKGNLVVKTADNTTSSISFENEYNAEGKIEFSGNKTLEGKTLVAGAYTFVLLDEDGKEIGRKTNSEDGTFAFDEIKYTLEDLNGKITAFKKYAIKEIAGDEDYIEYDKTVYEFEVTLTDNGNGTILAESNKDTASFNFKNTYKAEGETTIEVLKILTGKEWSENDSFVFTVTPAEGSPTPEKTSVTITKDTKDYKDNFGKIVFTKAGTYTYTISEEHKGETINGITHDKEDKVVKFVVTDDGEGNLVATTTDNTTSSVEFTNTYSAEGKIEFSGNKTLEGKTLVAGAYTFVLLDEDGKEIDKKTNAEDGTFSFDEIKYTLEDLNGKTTAVKKYIIKEIAGDEDYIEYDKTVYEFEVTLTDKGNGTILAESNKETTSFNFKNTYRVPVSVSKIDATTREELEGATIQLLNSELNVIEEWISTKEPHVVEGLKANEEYTLRETIAPNGYTITSEIKFYINEEGKVITEASTNTDENGNTVILIEDYLTPEFEKKIKDTNDTTGEVSEWQDSADYDIGDEVPFRLSAVLAENVTSYTKYFITFNDIMEKGLTFKDIDSVKINGNTLNEYELESNDHSFKLTIRWGDGSTKINDTSLNGAEIEVIFTSLLNEQAILGSQGNLNTAYLEYSNNPNVETDKDRTEDDYAIVFTYKVEIDKLDDNEKSLNGAKFKLEKKMADGTTKEVNVQINSEETTFTFVGIDDGEYILTETSAPEGYKKVNPIEFMVTADHNVLFTNLSERNTVLTKLNGELITGEINLKSTDEAELIGKVTNSKNKISIIKLDITSKKELEGAVLQVIDKEGNIVEEWTSIKDAHVIEGLKSDEEYTLREKIAPKGYEVTSDTTFTIDENGNVTSSGNIVKDAEGNIVILIEDEIIKKDVRIKKIDVLSEEELEGATLQVINKDGSVIEEWISTKEVHLVEGLNIEEEYTLREIVAPEGYKLTSDTKFKIEENGNIITSCTTTTDEDGNIVLLVEDEKTSVSISKADQETKELLAGATLQILDKDGNIIKEWVSTKETYKIEGLKTGVEYILRETKAPEDYKITQEITFTIDEEGNIITTGNTITDENGKTIIVLEDERITYVLPAHKNPKTADYFDLYVALFNIFILGFITGINYLRKYSQV